MRVTHNMMSNNLLRNLSNASGRMIDIQNQMSSGARINKPSDDPVGVETAMRLKSTLMSMQQWKQNVSEGRAHMESIEGTLNGLMDMTHRLRELAIQGANGASTADDRVKIKNEVDQIIKQFEQSANAQFNGRYVFSGTRSDKEALISDSVSWTGSAYELSWGGNDKPVNIEVGPGLLIDISVNGENLFGIDPPGPGAARTSQLFTTLYRLSDALQNDDYSEINAVIGSDGDTSDPFTLSEVTNHLLAVRSDLGARTNRLENIQKQIETNILNVQQSLSSVADIDMAEAIIQFKSTQNVYQAALAVGAQIIQPSLVDYMR
ncbi:MAG: flagellar hook-associated protein FlgL [Peptococcaceae bacterium]|nr:flagellar hook-associated protein FlgL [Peptococcaceae bacterium]